MRVSYPQGSIQCIVTDDIKDGFTIWCGTVVCDFRKLDRKTNPTTVRCKVSGEGPVESFAMGTNGYVTGTIVYDLDGNEPRNEGRSNFLTFTTQETGKPFQLVFEISVDMFDKAFNDDEQRALRYRMPEEDRRARSGW